MRLQNLVLSVMVTSVAAFSQSTVDTPFQVSYAAFLAPLRFPPSTITFTNTGARGAALPSAFGLTGDQQSAITGAICANLYAFSPDEQEVSCCSCPVTPNALLSMDTYIAFSTNTLTGVSPTSLVIKMVGTAPVNNSCVNSAATVGQPGVTPVSGLFATASRNHLFLGEALKLTETPFSPATLSQGEANRLGTLCSLILANGSGQGSCAAGCGAQLPTTGSVQVCKVAGVGVGIGTNFVFNVNGTPQTIPAGAAPSGTCGAPVTVLAGLPATIIEATDGSLVTSITTLPSAGLLLSGNLTAGTATVTVNAGEQTTVTFTDIID